jgi:hypothetical protein
MNDLDELMSRDPMDLSAQDIDSIVLYHRRQRARRAAGEKTTKPKVDISGIMGTLKSAVAPAVKITRRI